MPLVNYARHTRPQGDHGLFAHDINCAYAFTADAGAQLVPLKVPRGLPASEPVAKLLKMFWGGQRRRPSIFCSATELGVGEMRHARRARRLQENDVMSTCNRP